ncbi:MAG: multiheme c-type cytochrome [Campylobacterota bacterium]|nr:multiheme c-type cytochrome [Campylobacterota bacterium]
MSILKSSVFILLVAAVIGSFYIHKDTTLIKGQEADYIGSDSCKQCHNKKHHSWHHSTHPKIFQKYSDRSQIVADFKNRPDFVKFDEEDIEVIVGGKWEQVFAREIDGEYYPFPAKWLNLTKEWVPYKTDKWRDTPLNQKCNGCHTTGLNVKTGEFKEYGVSCESCHGPASRHVQNKRILGDPKCTICHSSKSLKDELEKEMDIVVSIKSAVCGQCHSRGIEKILNSHETQVEFNFPIEYLPGQMLSKNFQQTTPQSDKKGKNWWGNGISKNRHQEYADFAKSGHSKSLRNLRTKRRVACKEHPNDNCLKCHSGDYIIAKRQKDRLDNKKSITLPTIDNAKDSITCVVCHQPHKVGDSSIKVSDKCIECHTKDTKTLKEHKKHYPCPSQKVTCVDCHMPKIAKTGGKFTIRSHAFRIIPPEATIKYGMPNSCQNGSCHADRSTKWAIDEYSKFYKDRNITKNLAKEIKGWSSE